ncbi:MAG: hypothetical protein QOF28_2846 [Actinomycetota bacterium]|nr:hypothetical protein [Actinomycetota bacterium]
MPAQGRSPARLSPQTGSVSLARSGGREQDDWHDPALALAVALEAGIGAGERVRQGSLFCGVGDSRQDGPPCAGKLDHGFRLTLQVEPPVGRTVAPAIGGNDCDRVTVMDTRERGRVGPTGSASGRGDERDVAAVPAMTESAPAESMYRDVRPRKRLGGQLGAAPVKELVHIDPSSSNLMWAQAVLHGFTRRAIRWNCVGLQPRSSPARGTSRALGSCSSAAPGIRPWCSCRRRSRQASAGSAVAARADARP